RHRLDQSGAGHLAHPDHPRRPADLRRRGPDRRLRPGAGRAVPAARGPDAPAGRGAAPGARAAPGGHEAEPVNALRDAFEAARLGPARIDPALALAAARLERGPDDPVISAYLGALHAMKAGAATLPWIKLRQDRKRDG